MSQTWPASDDLRAIRIHAALCYWTDTRFETKPASVSELEWYADREDDITLSAAHLRRIFAQLSADPSFTPSPCADYLVDQAFAFFFLPYLHAPLRSDDLTDLDPDFNPALRCDPGDLHDVEVTTGIHLLKRAEGNPTAQGFLIPMLADASIEIAARANYRDCIYVLDTLAATVTEFIDNHKLTNDDSMTMLACRAAQGWRFDLLKLHHKAKGNLHRRFAAYYEHVILSQKSPQAVNAFIDAVSPDYGREWARARDPKGRHNPRMPDPRDDLHDAYVAFARGARSLEPKAMKAFFYNHIRTSRSHNKERLDRVRQHEIGGDSLDTVGTITTGAQPDFLSMSADEQEAMYHNEDLQRLLTRKGKTKTLAIVSRILDEFKKDAEDSPEPRKEPGPPITLEEIIRRSGMKAHTVKNAFRSIRAMDLPPWAKRLLLRPATLALRRRSSSRDGGRSNDERETID